MTLAALDRVGVPYRIAYTSENCSEQEAALLSDLAISHLPQSMAHAHLRKLTSHGATIVG